MIIGYMAFDSTAIYTFWKDQSQSYLTEVVRVSSE